MTTSAAARRQPEGTLRRGQATVAGDREGTTTRHTSRVLPVRVLLPSLPPGARAPPRPPHRPEKPPRRRRRPAPALADWLKAAPPPAPPAARLHPTSAALRQRQWARTRTPARPVRGAASCLTENCRQAQAESGKPSREGGAPTALENYGSCIWPNFFLPRSFGGIPGSPLAGVRGGGPPAGEPLQLGRRTKPAGVLPRKAPQPEGRGEGACRWPHHVLQVQRLHAAAGRGSGVRRLQPPGKGWGPPPPGRPRGGDLRRPLPCAQLSAPRGRWGSRARRPQVRPPEEPQPVEAAGLGPSPARWRRGAGVAGRAHAPGRRALGCCCGGDCLACRPGPPRQGLREPVAFISLGRGLPRPPCAPAVHLANLACRVTLGGARQGKAFRSTVHLPIQFWGALGVVARS